MDTEKKNLDKVFLYAAHQVKGIRPLLRSFFSFLERQTDFYDASTEAAQHMVLAAFQEFSEVHRERKTDKCVPIPNVEPGCIEELGSEELGSEKLGSEELGSEELGSEKTMDNGRTDKFYTKSLEETESDDEEHENGFYTESRRTKKGSVYPNEGDGATYKHYKWTQTPSELEVLLPLCKHRQKVKSTLQVDYTPSSIFVYIENKKIFGGCLADGIKSNEVTWTVEDNVLCIRAEKCKTSWWKQLLITEPMLLLKPILRKHASLGDISEKEMRQFQQTVVNKRDYTIAKHQEQFPDTIPIPENLA